MERLLRTLWGGVAVLVAVGVVWFAADRWAQSELAAQRRALDLRANELTQRALTPGSALACLDAVANSTVEAACEKALFANPETAAAAVAYVDAKLSLLQDGSAHAARDPDYAATLDRLRLGLEADRYGVVAQALTSRGCTAENCPALQWLRDPHRVAANLKERTFDANVVLNAAAWRPEGAALASAPHTALVPPAASSPPAAAGTPVSRKFEFPSAASIPPVSIMDAEPPLSKAEETAIAPSAAVPPPAATAAKPQPSRRPSVSQPANVPLPQPAPR
jgi:hypothetical protein